MNKTFIYNTNPSQLNYQNVPAPIFSDFTHTSEVAQRMIRAKQIEETLVPNFTNHDIEYIDIPFMP